MKNLRVRDSSATAEQPKRVHDVIINGEIKQIEFAHGKDTILPYEVGVKFMQEGFTVSDENGELHRPAKTDETIRFRISEDEVVARYDELTTTSLTMRASILPGGEKFVGTNPKNADLIAFLKAAAAPVAEDDDQIEQDDALEKEKQGFTPEAARAAGYSEDAIKGMCEKYGVEYTAPEEPKETPPAASELVWTPVQGSSQVNGFAYDGPNQRLYIEFKGEGFPVWAYEGVSAEKFQGFQAAESKGSFVAQQIKKAGHKETKMNKADFLQPAQPDPETGLPSAEPPDEV